MTPLPPEESLADEAIRLNEEGRRLSAGGDHAGAVAAYRAAAAADPTWSIPWYNLGLHHKQRGAWADSARCGREAVERAPGDGDAWWNLGIAATALGDWTEARRAWAACGIELPDGEGPIEADLGLTPVRLNPAGAAEVVWCDRVDPARAIVRNIPFPSSGFRYGDVVLHDGAPTGTRLRGGVEVPVFDALARLTVSPFRTYLLDLPGSTDGVRFVLEDVAHELGGAAEDWTRSVRLLCRSCSEGRPHEQHDQDLSTGSRTPAVALAARTPEEADAMIEAWRARTGYDAYVGISCADEGAG